MTTKTIQMYRTNLDGSETTLYPLTEAKYVTMDDGTTIEEALTNSDSSKYSPVIESSKAMFKVGEGDSVDLSESAIDGAYNSCVLKGKTMVNCIQEPSSQDVVLPYEFEDGQYVTINDTKESGALGVELKGQTLVNLLGELTIDLSSSLWSEDENNYILDLATGNGQPTLSFRTLYTLPANKTYTLFINMTSYTTGLIHIDFRTPSNTSSSSNQRYFGEAGWQKLVFTTTEETAFVRMFNRNGVDNTFSISKSLILLEGDHTNTPIPNYFTGMTSCKMPILKTVGKNLLNDNTSVSGWIMEDGTTTIRGALGSDSDYLSDFIYVGNINQIKISRGCYVTTFDENKKIIYQFVNVTGVNVSNCSYIRIAVSCNGQTALGLVGTIQVEEGAVATTYEPYKSSILSLPEEVVLRSLPNGVRDTFNTRTGVYTQRVGAMVLNGSDPITSRMQQTDNVLTTTSRCYLDYASIPSDISMKPFSSANEVSNKLICDILPVKAVVPNMQQDDIESVGQTTAGFSIRVKGKTIAECRQRLAEQPITIQYELATPVVTKINLPSTLKSWNTTTHIYSEIPENTLYPILSHSNPSYPVILKPSTKYSIVANSYSNDHTNSAINFNLGGATASTTVGNRVTTITTPSTLTSEKLVMSGRGNKLNNVMVIEGDVAGDEPYFEGICDVKSPILSNVGKNLVNPNNYINYPDNNISVKKDGEDSYILENKTTGNWRYQIGDKVKLKANTTYTLSYDYELLSESVPMNYGAVINLRDESNHNKNISGDAAKGKPRTFTTTEDVTVRLAMYITDTSGGINKIKYYNIQVVEAPTVLDYETYKSNTTTFDQKDDKTIVLRSLPKGVCDTLNIETGEYVQRIGEVVLCGNNDEMWSVDTRRNNRIGFVSRATYGQKVGSGEGAVISDKLVTVRDGDVKYSMDYTIALGAIANYPIVITVPFNAVDESLNTEQNNTVSINSFKTWLSQNPVTVQYELATPIVTTVDVQGFPYAYTNGHVQLSSGSIEQSLTPKVEYSLVANRNGQIEANTKSIRRHQDKLDDFEALMLTQMIQTHYEKTLLQFDFEMQMMALGGE